MQKETIESNVIALNSQGQGICELNGLKVFVEDALPGERISMQIVTQKKSYAIGKKTSINSPSEDRVKPICPIFGVCGGCQIMHLSYEAQLKYKTEKVKHAFERIAKLDVEVAPCIDSPKPLHYRNKIQLPFFEKSNQLKLGLYQKRSNQPVEVQHCFIHDELGEQVFSFLKDEFERSSFPVFNEATQKGCLRHLLIRSSQYTQKLMVTFICYNKRFMNPLKKIAEKLQERFKDVSSVMLNINQKRYNTLTGDKTFLLVGDPFIQDQILGLTFNISANSFFQVNTLQAEKIYQKALALAEIKTSDRILDAYCGTGTLSLLAAQLSNQVIGVECVPQAIADAQKNAAQNHITNCKFICQPVEEYIHKSQQFDVAFINPPRKGCDPKVLTVLAQSKPRRLVYISCDPATLARDAKILIEHGFKLQAVHPFDMFPQTSHVETCCLFTS